VPFLLWPSKQMSLSRSHKIQACSSRVQRCRHFYSLMASVSLTNQCGMRQNKEISTTVFTSIVFLCSEFDGAHITHTCVLGSTFYLAHAFIIHSHRWLLLGKNHSKVVSIRSKAYKIVEHSELQSSTAQTLVKLLIVPVGLFFD
jgi:hypothetical protein